MVHRREVVMGAWLGCCVGDACCIHRQVGSKRLLKASHTGAANYRARGAVNQWPALLLKLACTINLQLLPLAAYLPTSK